MLSLGPKGPLGNRQLRPLLKGEQSGELITDFPETGTVQSPLDTPVTPSP